MAIPKPLIVLILVLTVSCASPRYLGTNLPQFALAACSVERTECSRHFDGLGNQGGYYSVYALYALEQIEGNAYSLGGKARIQHEHPAITKISYLDLYFVFFNGNMVVHEEKIRLRGEVDEDHEFSRQFASESVIESVLLINFGWRLTE